ncbi:hypothetical protein ACQKCU_15315 [Heyndrickxia sporothermodurans]
MEKKEFGYYKKNPFKTFKYSNSIWNLIKKEKIQHGMTKNQVRLSWGDPTDTHSYGGSFRDNGTMDLWRCFKWRSCISLF